MIRCLIKDYANDREYPIWVEMVPRKGERIIIVTIATEMEFEVRNVVHTIVTTRNAESSGVFVHEPRLDCAHIRTANKMAPQE